MILKEFHSSVSTWFNQTFRAPSEIQVQAWPQIRKNKNTLISAPTGSGKTLAAFLEAIDSLIQQGLTGKLSNETQIVYVSPLKALSNDIHKNLQLPIQGIEKIMEDQGLPRVKIRVMVRTGDTPTSQRTAMIKNPPHILVTTPESLYLLLTSENGRKMLATTRTVIIDEIHALVGNKRGSHLSLSLERLSRLTPKPPLRIGLSATQRPIEKVAKFLVGGSGQPNCKILDAGHQRKVDLALEIPRSPLTAVMANEVWEEIHQRLEELILQHHTTLIFVNTRSLTERLAHHLTERLGSEMITAHHGSMSKEHRLEAEQNLKEGKLRALVATASLELGIDIGSVDLVCQLGSPKSIATFLQRVGRSGHSVDGTPKGRLFPLSRDELVESVAILDAIRRGELDKIVMPEKPLDVLAQQIIAETSNQEYHEDELYNMVKNAYPYRNLEKDEFSNLLQMMADGFSPRQGRRRAHIYRDLVHRTVKGRKGARLTALISGGTIPDQFDYDVILEPSSTYIGNLNEDFAIESMPGDIFQLGNNSWRILRVETGKVRVQDAQGLPPSMPFWLGEAPGRTIELSQAVSFLREEISDRLGDLEHLPGPQEDGDAPSEQWKNEALKWLTQDVKIPESAADQVVTYLGISKAALGVMPSHKNIVLERFFDEVGDMHLVIHSCFGSRLNRAWGLALRKRFCRKFNFELQAAANEDAIVLSLGATHSFPLEEVFSYLNPKTVRNVLVQALLDAPMFNVRWRWNASTALAIQRRRGGVRVPPQIQRSQAEDLIALVFPDQLACLENISGEREVPDHPLVLQTIHDCLYEAMDIEELEKLLTDLRAGKLNLVAKDLREPSPMSQEILNARPYTFLDNAPLEERRTNAIKNRKWLDPSEAKELSHLDEAAIEAVKTESWPQITSPEELHDTLILFGFITEKEGIIGSNEQNWEQYLSQLIASGQATTLKIPNLQKIWVALERTEQFNLVFDQPKYQPELKITEELQKTLAQNNKCTDPMDALVEIIRGRLEALGPVTIEDLVASLGLPMEKIDQALVLLENDGFVF
ncbi:MAG: DEAD/DEAH box helicase, partial [Bacteroidetes bacterium]|nr:DEAD/DEAH box helicase [Bacteroidota bacterium]